MLGWVVSWGQGPPLALALDAPTVGQRLVVLVIRVVSRGWALPGAWVILPAGATHAWRRPALPRGWPVIVLAARGLEAPWWFRRSTRRGWPPFVRLNTGGSFRPAGAPCWRPLMPCVPRPGTRGRGVGRALTRLQVAGTVLARWEEGSKDPGLIRTDLPPAASDAGWEGRRAGIDQGCKRTNRAGWPGHRTRRTDPARAARRWLAVAGATVWWRRGGGAAEETRPASTLRDGTAWCPGHPRSRRATRLRLVRVFRPGWVALLVAWLRQEPWPEGRCVPEPWPAVPGLEDEAWEPTMALPEAA